MLLGSAIVALIVAIIFWGCFAIEVKYPPHPYILKKEKWQRRIFSGVGAFANFWLLCYIIDYYLIGGLK